MKFQKITSTPLLIVLASFILACLSSRTYFFVILIYISLVLEHIFICLWAVHISFLVKWLFSSVHFKIDVCLLMIKV